MSRHVGGLGTGARPADVGAAGPLLHATTGIAEADRVLGGGLVPGGVTLLAGEPGIGKSTLVMQMLAGAARGGGRGLLVTGEESLEQVGLRARRLGVGDAGFTVAAMTDTAAIVAACGEHEPSLVVVDSIQTVVSPEIPHVAGSLVQVRESAAALVRHAKATGTAVVLIGHVTKDGGVAGPKTLEHIVDTILTIEGDRSGTLRFLRSTKNRFGPCDETGVFTMTVRGLEAVGDPSAMLLADRHPGARGSAVLAAMDGSRPLLVEIQALVAQGTPQPRRVAIGVSAKRLAMLLAILERAGIDAGQKDVFVAAAGGVSITEPAADLALCVALASEVGERALDAGTVVVGEVGLGGEVRRVPHVKRRLSEAARMGFTRAIVPAGDDIDDSSLAIDHVRSVADALRAALPGGAVVPGGGRARATLGELGAWS
ncbi:MAG TPA: DNA repair protein RadA [Actinomycetota bacterium]|nr:DNA repair protein RadA [Actinomycetota bacterium]